MCSKYLAEKIAERMGADIIPIELVKAYPDKEAVKFFWGGKSAVMGENPDISGKEQLIYRLYNK